MWWGASIRFDKLLKKKNNHSINQCSSKILNPFCITKIVFWKRKEVQMQILFPNIYMIIIWKNIEKNSARINFTDKMIFIWKNKIKTKKKSFINFCQKFVENS